MENEILQKINAFETRQCALELVTVDGYPMSLLDKPAFRYLIQSKLNNLANNGHHITINRSLIVNNIEETSDAVRREIMNELKSVHLISLMMDISTKMTLSVLGLIVSFTKDDEVVHRLLGVIPINKRHTGDNIAELVVRILVRFIWCHN